MKDLLPFLIVGVVSGSLYGLAGMGLVLTFRTSGIFNFAHGAVAAAAAYLFYDLRFSLNLPWPVAFLATVAVIAAVSGILLERLNRSLTDVRPVMTILATVGLLLAISGLITWHYGPSTLDYPGFLPTSGVQLAGVTVQYGQLLIVASGALLAGALYWFVQRTEIGAAMRGVVDDPSLIGLTGRRPSTVRILSWAIGSGFAALSGILLATTVGRDVFLLTLLVIQAFGAAAIGQFRSLPLTYTGGIVTGVSGAVMTKYVAASNNAALAGLPTAVPFLILFGVLILLPKGRLPSQRAARPRTRARRAVPPGLARLGTLATLVAAVMVPSMVGSRLPVFTNALVFVVIFLSLALLVWTSGQLSLCHAAFVAVGATSFSHLTTGAGLPWGVALVLAGLATIPIGALVALPAIRLSGIYLALATFGFGVLMQRVVYTSGVMFGGGSTSQTRTAARPSIPGFGGYTDREYYFVVLAVVLMLGVLLALVLRSRLGRVLRALADSPTALTVHGLATTNTRLLVFSLSAALAGIGGALTVPLFGSVRQTGFGPFESLTWVAVLALSGTALFRSSIVAALVLAVLPSYAPSNFGDYQTLLFGALAIAIAVLSGRAGFRPAVSARVADRLALSPMRDRIQDAMSSGPDLVEARRAT